MAATCEELASQSIQMQSVMDLLKYGAEQADGVKNNGSFMHKNENETDEENYDLAYNS